MHQHCNTYCTGYNRGSQIAKTLTFGGGHYQGFISSTTYGYYDEWRTRTRTSSWTAWQDTKNSGWTDSNLLGTQTVYRYIPK